MGSGSCWAVFAGAGSRIRQSAKMLNRFWVGMFGVVSMPDLISFVDLGSNGEMDRGLLQGMVVGYSSSVAFLLAVGQG